MIAYRWMALVLGGSLAVAGLVGCRDTVSYPAYVCPPDPCACLPCLPPTCAPYGAVSPVQVPGACPTYIQPESGAAAAVSDWRPARGTVVR